MKPDLSFQDIQGLAQTHSEQADLRDWVGSPIGDNSPRTSEGNLCMAAVAFVVVVLFAGLGALAIVLLSKVLP